MLTTRASSSDEIHATSKKSLVQKNDDTSIMLTTTDFLKPKLLLSSSLPSTPQSCNNENVRLSTIKVCSPGPLHNSKTLHLLIFLRQNRLTQNPVFGYQHLGSGSSSSGHITNSTSSEDLIYVLSSHHVEATAPAYKICTRSP